MGLKDRYFGTPEDAEEILSRSRVDYIDDAEVLQRVPNPSPGISLRLSEPLLERLDNLAASQHRTRSNLIQHILWEYLRKVAKA